MIRCIGFHHRFLYYEAEELNLKELAQGIMYCAKKYIITKLFQLCATVINERLTNKNVCSLLQASFSLHEDILADACMSFIDDHAEDILKQSHHLGLHRDVWKKVVQSDCLDAKEATIMNACAEWSRARCEEQKIVADAQNIREQLGDILYDIRFPRMSLTEFSDCTEEWDILNKGELKEIIKYLGCKNEDKPAISFCCKSRVPRCVEGCQVPTEEKNWHVPKGKFDRMKKGKLDRRL